MEDTRREVLQGRVIRVTVDTATLPNGRRTDLEIVHHPCGAAVVAVDDTGRVCLCCTNIGTPPAAASGSCRTDDRNRASHLPRPHVGSSPRRPWYAASTVVSKIPRPASAYCAPPP
jgi:hypothetical protein